MVRKRGICYHPCTDLSGSWLQAGSKLIIKISRSFYNDLGFEEIVIDSNLSLFQKEEFGFYLQNYYVKDWVENTMLFLEVDDVHKTFEELKQAGLDKKYIDSKISPVKKEVWGEVCFVHDPTGILLHFAQVYK